MQTTLFPNDDGKVTILKEDNYVPCSDLVTDIVYGDLFELGNHRLLCGDCLKMGDVDYLLDGGSVDITFTSPPYNTCLIVQSLFYVLIRLVIGSLVIVNGVKVQRIILSVLMRNVIVSVNIIMLLFL